MSHHRSFQPVADLQRPPQVAVPLAEIGGPRRPSTRTPGPGEAFAVLPPRQDEPPAPPAAPEPYRVAQPPHRARKASFVILTDRMRGSESTESAESAFGAAGELATAAEACTAGGGCPPPVENGCCGEVPVTALACSGRAPPCDGPPPSCSVPAGCARVVRPSRIPRSRPCSREQSPARQLPRRGSDSLLTPPKTAPVGSRRLGPRGGAKAKRASLSPGAGRRGRTRERNTKAERSPTVSRATSPIREIIPRPKEPTPPPSPEKKSTDKKGRRPPGVAAAYIAELNRKNTARSTSRPPFAKTAVEGKAGTVVAADEMHHVRSKAAAYTVTMETAKASVVPVHKTTGRPGGAASKASAKTVACAATVKLSSKGTGKAMPAAADPSMEGARPVSGFKSAMIATGMKKVSANEFVAGMRKAAGGGGSGTPPGSRPPSRPPSAAKNASLAGALTGMSAFRAGGTGTPPGSRPPSRPPSAARAVHLAGALSGFQRPGAPGTPPGSRPPSRPPSAAARGGLASTVGGVTAFRTRPPSAKPKTSPALKFRGLQGLTSAAAGVNAFRRNVTSSPGMRPRGSGAATEGTPPSRSRSPSVSSVAGGLKAFGAGSPRVGSPRTSPGASPRTSPSPTRRLGPPNLLVTAPAVRRFKNKALPPIDSGPSLPEDENEEPSLKRPGSATIVHLAGAKNAFLGKGSSPTGPPSPGHSPRPGGAGSRPRPVQLVQPGPMSDKATQKSSQQNEGVQTTASLVKEGPDHELMGASKRARDGGCPGRCARCFYAPWRALCLKCQTCCARCKCSKCCQPKPEKAPDDFSGCFGGRSACCAKMSACCGGAKAVEKGVDKGGCCTRISPCCASPRCFKLAPCFARLACCRPKKAPPPADKGEAEEGGVGDAPGEGDPETKPVSRWRRLLGRLDCRRVLRACCGSCCNCEGSLKSARCTCTMDCRAFFCAPLERCRERCRRKRQPTISSKKSTSMEEPELPKLDPALVEHGSAMRAAIPVLPLPLAWLCLIFNILVPGFGTLFSGLLCLCIGKPRFSVRDDAAGRIGAFFVDLVIALGQAFTVFFCLVGWGWSIWWGVIMIRIAKKSRKLAQAALEDTGSRGSNAGLPGGGAAGNAAALAARALQPAAPPAAAPAQNHDVERGAAAS